jgi:cyclopropane-fatty-acyl-phospholipid synthase
MTLEDAQDAKKQHLAAKLILRPGQRVLDVGCGWGGLALYLAETAGVSVTGITRSPEQLAVARRRAAESQLPGQVSFRLAEVAMERGPYDRIISVGALAHARPGERRVFFERIRDLLADDGVAVIQLVGRMDGPGSGAPALSEFWPALERARLWVTDVEVLRLHHAETLRCWRERLVQGWDRVAAVHGVRFCRAWELDLALAEAAFRHGALVVYELQLTKRVDAAPLTREYMYERPSPLAYEVEIAA